MIWHMPSLLFMHLYGKFGNSYATHEVAPINDVFRIAVQA